jgi:hypothetical protein
MDEKESALSRRKFLGFAVAVGAAALRANNKAGTITILLSK